MTRLQPKLAAGASLVGTTIEYYDFFVYATAAALVFDKVFFPALGGLAGTIVSLSTFAVGFVVRPLGGVVIGHLGDKFGRRPMLIMTLTLMGVCTLLIGLLPGYQSIGVLAPILLIALRVLQGFALGGEFGGAVVLTVEHSPPQRRGFFGSFVQMGGPLALVLSSLVFIPLYTLPDEQFLSWGWRVPFLVSAVLVGVGYLVRRAVTESPTFAEAKRAGDVHGAPALAVIRRHPLLIVAIAGTTLVGGVGFYVMAVFGLSYGTETVGFSHDTILLIVMLSFVLDCAFVFAAGVISDRIGRPRLMLAGMLGMGVLAFPWLWLLSSGNAWLAFLGYVVMCVPHAAIQGVAGVFMSEVFPVEVRYSGLSIGYTIGMLCGSAIAPMVATALVATAGVAALGWYLVAMCVLSTVSVLAIMRSGVAVRDGVDGRARPASESVS